ncbi:homeobox domain protein [Rhizoctonia solani AG-3 Rhs1AP]|uniref:Homeobox domain protein n=1 Tax=Rhizoctonia solani AG-3 Rhs1AP TaxID=1086054 RepID=X8IX61_9AGAM|nr:homeobox domain protein [Rhizoctonia solani AG-3 Rhs1AP]
MSQQSNQYPHSIQAFSRDGFHRGAQVYPVEHSNEAAPCDPSSRANPPAPGDSQYQRHQARGEPAIQTMSHSDYQTPQHYMSGDAHSRAEGEGDLERVLWQEGPPQTAEAFYTQDSSMVPGATLLMSLDHERQESPMVSRHPSLQTFGPYTTTALQSRRDSSTFSSTSDHSRSRSTPHILHSAHQPFQPHQIPHNSEAPQYVVPSSRIPRADSTARDSPPGYYNTAGVSYGPEMSETKPKRRRANAAQLKLLNDTYARTMFPTTEERADIARRINMTPRQVQIW